MRAQTPLLFLLAAAALAPPLAGQDIRPGGPTSAGVRATADLPVSQHLRNTGGVDGLGLCVFTSAEVASRWQSSALTGFQQWMTRQPGGGYPEKLEEMVVRFCRETRRDIPPYVQHTGGDEQVLDLAVRTGRMPCITYAGRDDFYGDQVIAHMVNLAHLDAERAAVVDNNRPGVWVWMSRKQLLDRWRGVDANGRPLTVPTRRGPMQVGGGWAVVFLDPPPPPYAAKPAEERAAAERVQYGQWCPPGVRSWGSGPAAGPVAQPVQPVSPDEYNRAAEAVQAGERIVLVVGPPPGWFREGDVPVPVHRSPSFAAVADGVYSCWPDQGEAKMKRVGSAEQLPARPVGQKAEPKVQAKPADTNFGVDLERMNGAKRWFCNGAECGKEEALAVLAGGTLTDDSERWFLIHVGTEAERAKFMATVKALPPATLGRVHVKSYGPGDWPVAQFDLPAGVSIRKAAANRVGAEAGRFVGEVSADALTRFVADAFAPPPRPMPAPPPGPTPDPTPAPEPAPNPSGPLGIPLWIVAAIAVAVTYLLTRRR